MHDQRIGLMGFGRIGRNVFRLLSTDDRAEVGAIVDVADPKALAYLLKYDSIYGRFQKSVDLDGNELIVDGVRIPIINAREPGEVDWSEHAVTTVIQATGKYRTKDWCQRHLDRGARRVILASTPEDPGELPILLKGVNDHIVTADTPIVAMGSNTSNALAPALDVLHSAFGIERMFFTTVHAYTNRERLADVPSEGFRTSRAAGENIIPSETNSPEILAQVYPDLAGKITAMALNVPVENGSTVDTVTFVGRATSKEEVNEAFRAAAAGKYAGILEYQTDPIVSTDVWGSPYSGIYDNGWGYSNRILETLELFAQEVPA